MKQTVNRLSVHAPMRKNKEVIVQLLQAILLEWDARLRDGDGGDGIWLGDGVASHGNRRFPSLLYTTKPLPPLRFCLPACLSQAEARREWSICVLYSSWCCLPVFFWFCAGFAPGRIRMRNDSLYQRLPPLPAVPHSRIFSINFTYRLI